MTARDMQIEFERLV
jgi:hypothetical protein